MGEWGNGEMGLGVVKPRGPATGVRECGEAGYGNTGYGNTGYGNTGYGPRSHYRFHCTVRATLAQRSARYGSPVVPRRRVRESASRGGNAVETNDENG